MMASASTVRATDGAAASTRLDHSAGTEQKAEGRKRRGEREQRGTALRRPMASAWALLAHREEREGAQERKNELEAELWGEAHSWPWPAIYSHARRGKYLWQ